ncbi:HTH-type transcriptional activator RhaR [Kordia antarctica]|uniref:HTH-type transcriptional activator RhaR n=2 Tax=Kordia antarctica TaxID=1218801 RepID=A0A7L4ZK37_9FLAO|nr:HTH-type transcriptional activator RhaR [Kordia antarctica]
MVDLKVHYRKSDSTMKLYIKYMVSLRCKLMVKLEIEKLGLQYTSIQLGMIEINENITDEVKEKLKLNLAVSGLELLDDKKSILIDKIKTIVIEMIHYSDEVPRVNFSDFISKKLDYDYTYLSNIFSEVNGITIQHFIIKHKIEKAKELILYDELNLTEIAYRLHYSSVAHLSNQFKKVTGQTPSFYKKISEKRKSNLENL